MKTSLLLTAAILGTAALAGWLQHRAAATGLAAASPDNLADIAATLTPLKWLAARTQAASTAPAENPQ